MGSRLPASNHSPSSVSFSPVPAQSLPRCAGGIPPFLRPPSSYEFGPGRPDGLDSSTPTRPTPLAPSSFLHHTCQPPRLNRKEVDFFHRSWGPPTEHRKQHFLFTVPSLPNGTDFHVKSRRGRQLSSATRPKWRRPSGSPVHGGSSQAHELRAPRLPNQSSSPCKPQAAPSAPLMPQLRYPNTLFQRKMTAHRWDSVPKGKVCKTLFIGNSQRCFFLRQFSSLICEPRLHLRFETVG